jgi:8-oxo-dGTP pyrophosphatase MutT (NUDIX family)
VVFRTEGESVLFAGSLVSVARVELVDPDGSRFEREVVHHPGAVSVVPVIGSQALLIRQFRAAVGHPILEIPAGKRDVAGESPEATARRELEEEIGMRAGRLREVADFYNSPGFCDEHSYLFIADDLERCASAPQGAEERHLTVERIDLDDVAELVARRVIVDAKTIIGLLIAKEAAR